MRTRNALVDINTLPDELLCHIFSAAAEENIVAIAAVCARWRRICLTTPVLWSNIMLSSQSPYGNALSLLALARTSGHTLGVTVSESDTSITHSFCSVAHLVRRLTLQSWEGNDWFSGGFSRLHHLHVSSRSHAIIPYPLEQQEPLKTMALYKCRFPYTASCYTGLTTLEITFPLMTDDAYDPFLDSHKSILDVLEACPDLESLTLQAAHVLNFREVIQLGHPSSTSPPPIPLLQLRCLNLHLYVYALHAFLGRIETASSLSQVHLAAYGTEIHEFAHSSTIPQTFLSLDHSTCLPALSAMRSCTIRARRYYEDHFVMNLIEKKTPTDLSLGFFPALFSSGEYMTAAWSNFFASAMGARSLCNLHTLYLDDCGPYGEGACFFEGERLAELLSAVPALRVLGVVVTDPVKLLRNVVAVRKAQSPPGGLIPELETVVIRGHSVHEDVAALSMLLRELHVRRVSLVTPSFRMGTVRELQDSGFEVDWTLPSAYDEDAGSGREP